MEPHIPTTCHALGLIFPPLAPTWPWGTPRNISTRGGGDQREQDAWPGPPALSLSTVP